MRIQSIEVFGYQLTYAHGEYVMSKGRAALSQPSTLVRVRTDGGLEGWGEVSTLSGTYLPAFTEGTRAAIRVLATAALGLDPCNLGLLHRAMDGELLGQANAKSALDIACWDILGKSLGVPVSTLLGGVMGDTFPLYEAVPLSTPEAMGDFVTRRGREGIARFQVKVGNDPYGDVERVRKTAEAAGSGAVIIADANGGWGLQAAIIAAARMSDLDIYIEQPCREIGDCALVQRHSRLPLVMDESVVTPSDLHRVKTEAGAGSVNIKLGRLGGITGAARMRDQAQGLAMTMCIEDVWGGDVTSAAVSHVAATTSPEALLHASFFNDWNQEHVAGYLPRSAHGRGAAPTGPGLGIEVDAAGLGAPLFTIS